MKFDELAWQDPKALRGKDSEPIVAPEVLDPGGDLLVGDFSRWVDFGEGAPSRWSFTPEEAYEKPAQLLAAQGVSDPQRDVHLPGRYCGHPVMIAINRGGPFCCENCRKDYERFSDRVKARIAKADGWGRWDYVHEIFGAAQGRLRKREAKEQ